MRQFFSTNRRKGEVILLNVSRFIQGRAVARPAVSLMDKRKENSSGVGRKGWRSWQEKTEPLAYLTNRKAGRLPGARSWLFNFPCFKAFFTRTPLIKK
jgi:hypothetical protein